MDDLGFPQQANAAELDEAKLDAEAEQTDLIESGLRDWLMDTIEELCLKDGEDVPTLCKGKDILKSFIKEHPGIPGWEARSKEVTKKLTEFVRGVREGRGARYPRSTRIVNINDDANRGAGKFGAAQKLIREATSGATGKRERTLCEENSLCGMALALLDNMLLMALIALDHGRATGPGFKIPEALFEYLGEDIREEMAGKKVTNKQIIKYKSGT